MTIADLFHSVPRVEIWSSSCGFSVISRRSRLWEAQVYFRVCACRPVQSVNPCNGLNYIILRDGWVIFLVSQLWMVRTGEETIGTLQFAPFAALLPTIHFCGQLIRNSHKLSAKHLCTFFAKRVADYPQTVSNFQTFGISKMSKFPGFLAFRSTSSISSADHGI